MLIGALEAGGTKMVCSIGNPQGGVLQRASFPTLTPDVTVPQIVDFIGKFDVKALGIGSFGPLDLNPASPTYGSITKTPKREWIDYPLMAVLKDALGVPTGIDTDVNAAALAEYTMGAGQGHGSLLYVTVGTGIGGGFVTEGKMIHGLVHPEMGHMILSPQEGDTMPDGVCPYHRHCLEGLASGPAIEARWGLAPEVLREHYAPHELRLSAVGRELASEPVAQHRLLVGEARALEAGIGLVLETRFRHHRATAVCARTFSAQRVAQFDARWRRP